MLRVLSPLVASDSFFLDFPGFVDVGVVLGKGGLLWLFLKRRRKVFGAGWSSSLGGGKSPFLHFMHTQAKWVI